MCQAEQDKTLKKLIHLLRQIMHDAGYAIISNESDDSRLFCIEQYNRIYTRLMEVDRALASVFAPLAPDSSPGIVRMAARDMASMLIEHLRKDRYRGIMPECFWDAFLAFTGFRTA